MDLPLCADDVVEKKSQRGQVGIVERTHGEIGTHDPEPGRRATINRDKDIPKSVFSKFMNDGIPPQGTVLVEWQHTTTQQLILESKLKAIDRSLLIGDIVKKSVRDAMSGVVINTHTSCMLSPLSDLVFSDNRRNGSRTALKGFVPGTRRGKRYRREFVSPPAPIEDVPASELKYEQSPNEDELVIYKDWIGRVADITRFISIRLSDNCVVEIPEASAEDMDEFNDFFSVGDIVTALKGTLRTGNWVYGQYNPETTPVGTVVRTRVTSLEVTWLEKRIGGDSNPAEPPSILERAELESPNFHIYDRTKRPQADPNSKDQSTISNSDIDAQLNLRVRFKDFSGACVKYDGSTGQGRITRIDRKDTLGYDLNVFEIKIYHTDVTVQWQDLSITRERSVDLTPEVAIDDEHDAWPGEIAHPLDFDPVSDSVVKTTRAVGVIQSVKPSERIAKIRWAPNATVQYVVGENEGPEQREILTRAIGVATGDVEEVSLYDIEAPGQLNVRRGDIVLIAKPQWTPAELDGGARDPDWLGEIVDTPLDGTLTVRLGAARRVRDVSIEREHVIVAIRSDMSDELDGWEEGSLSGAHFDMDGAEVSGESDMDDGDDDEDDSEDEYSSDGESDISGEIKYEDENGEPMDVEDVENEDWESDIEDDIEDIEDVEMEDHDAEEQTPLTSQSPTPPNTSTKQQDNQEPSTSTTTPANAPPPYLILSTLVPNSHAFSTTPPTENPAHTKRTQKEHKILRTPSNLPSGIYIRTWESRLDLFRALFIGPAETPYADTPFVVDFCLPSTFPADPPQAFFHSWSHPAGLGGVGRVNPNLYEDGKICLSLLGTWESGGKGSAEGWSPARSTLLQVLVSLQGLVLVREPYFQEAGYMELKGLESSRRASEVYSERVFLKARTFVLAVFDPGREGTEGLEDVVAWVYRAREGLGLLGKVVRDAEEVVRRSEGVVGGEVPVMSKGACISLRRILERLREL